MYSVSRVSHERHGSVILIERDENGMFVSPEQAVSFGIKERRLWGECGAKKVRFLIDNQLFTSKEAETWAKEEYHSLPKCGWCHSILGEDVFTHQLGKDNLFCTTTCANNDYDEKFDKLKDEEEIDYL